MTSTPPPLLYASTSVSADALYFGGVSMHDPFIAFGHRGKRVAVVSALEYSRVRRTSRFHRVLSLEDCLARARKAFPRRRSGPAPVIALLARELGQRHFTVPGDFPARLYVELKRLGVGLTVAPGPLFPQREIKTEQEAAKIREGNRCSARGIAAAEKILRESRIQGRRLIHRGRPLTSERLRIAIAEACLAVGSVSHHSIAAGGDQACDPHEIGTGLLRPHELIIVDVFPRVEATGYHGDMTRTFLRGQASEAQKGLVAAVRAAQREALRRIRAGVIAAEVHAGVNDTFAHRGFETRRTKRGPEGFFHGTGHGLGLEVHEAPRISAAVREPLRKGTVVTVEPGLYYPGLGGCRIEDVVQVTAKGHRLLSKYSYKWELS